MNYTMEITSKLINSLYSEKKSNILLFRQEITIPIYYIYYNNPSNHTYHRQLTTSEISSNNINFYLDIEFINKTSEINISKYDYILCFQFYMKPIFNTNNFKYRFRSDTFVIESINDLNILEIKRLNKINQIKNICI